MIRKDTALVFSNTHEGTVFVNPPTLIADNFTLEKYISTMFPRLSQKQVDAAVALYSDIGYTNITDTSALVMGECQSFVLALCVLRLGLTTASYLHLSSL